MYTIHLFNLIYLFNLFIEFIEFNVDYINTLINSLIIYKIINHIGDWGLGIGDWGLPNPQSPIPNPQFI